MPRPKVLDEIAAATDPTLALWKARQEKKDLEQAEKQKRQGRVTELERAFIAVRPGMPELGDNEQSARAFAARWAHLAHLLRQGPDLVHCPLNEIKAEVDSPKAYALQFVMKAFGNEANAAKLLLDSWQASKDCHGEVLSWLTWGLEAEIMGRNTEAKSSEPSLEQGPSGVDLKQLPPAITVKAVSQRSGDDQVAPPGTGKGDTDGAAPGKERLHFDPQTQTITLDGTPHKIMDPKAFAVYKAIASSCPEPVTKATLQDRVAGCRGDKKIRQLLNGLPKQLLDTVPSGPNGYWLHLNPLPNGGVRRRRKKGRT
jgi:hypothetical protein